MRRRACGRNLPFAEIFFCRYLYSVSLPHKDETEAERSGAYGLSFGTAAAGSVLAFAVLLVAAVVGTVVLTSQQPVALPAWSLFNKGIPGGEENQRIEFLRKYGWEAEVPPISEEEIVIPAEWDEVYTGYASLQQAQGFNLDKLRGKTVTEYTYHITNYPEKDEVAAHILVYKDRIIGADISEMEQGGFCMEVIPG